MKWVKFSKVYLITNILNWERIKFLLVLFLLLKHTSIFQIRAAPALQGHLVNANGLGAAVWFGRNLPITQSKHINMEASSFLSTAKL